MHANSNLLTALEEGDVEWGRFLDSQCRHGSVPQGWVLPAHYVSHGECQERSRVTLYTHILGLLQSFLLDSRSLFVVFTLEFCLWSFQLSKIRTGTARVMGYIVTDSCYPTQTKVSVTRGRGKSDNNGVSIREVTRGGGAIVSPFLSLT